ncbi:hypothetical protein [Aliarcobacter butzleri]|uniref:hypothetical protein n=1 Tax=Aliarcobacter butzleri TaxID=28197 RepID=UPI003AF9705A
MDEFLIIDENGIIHSGNEEKMSIAFASMIGNIDYFNTRKDFKEAAKCYQTDWSGDLQLVKVIDSCK